MSEKDKYTRTEYTPPKRYKLRWINRVSHNISTEYFNAYSKEEATKIARAKIHGVRKFRSLEEDLAEKGPILESSDLHPTQ